MTKLPPVPRAQKTFPLFAYIPAAGVVELTKPLEEARAKYGSSFPSDWHPVTAGPVAWRSYRCRVNGDGIRWQVRELLGPDGEYVGSVELSDGRTEEL